MGRSPCHMSIIRHGNVALSILRKSCVALSILRKSPIALLILTKSRVVLLIFKNDPCRMSLRPKKGRGAMLILGVYTHKEQKRQRGGNLSS